VLTLVSGRASRDFPSDRDLNSCQDLFSHPGIHTDMAKEAELSLRDSVD
jgi:hypothetical protein